MIPLLLLLLLPLQKAEPKRIEFARGTSSTIVRGSVKGYEVAEYVLKASKGQTMTIKATSPSPHIVFSVFDQEGKHFEGSASETTEWSGSLPRSGDYVIVTGLTRAASRRTKRSVPFSLKISIE